MKKETISTLGLILISTITSIRGLLHYIKGGMPDIIQTLLSIVYIICWMIVAYYYGKAGSKKFIIFTLLFWITGLIIAVVNYYTDYFMLIGITTYVVGWLPLYGVSRYFRSISLIVEPIIATAIILISTILAYIFGKRSGK